MKLPMILGVLVVGLATACGGGGDGGGDGGGGGGGDSGLIKVTLGETLPEVATGEYVMDIHKADGGDVVVCGVIPEQ